MLTVMVAGTGSGNLHIHVGVFEQGGKLEQVTTS